VPLDKTTDATPKFDESGSFFDATIDLSLSGYTQFNQQGAPSLKKTVGFTLTNS